MAPAIPAAPNIPTALPEVPVMGIPPAAIDVGPKIPAAGPSTPPSAPMIEPILTTPKPPDLKLPEPDKTLVPVATPKPPSGPVIGLPVSGGPPVPAVPAAPDFVPAPASTPVKPDFVPVPASTPVKPISGGPALPAPELRPTPVGSGSKPEPKPTTIPVAGIERSPTTTFDVDLHEPKAGDTYESISREFYNDTRYGQALRAYNRNKPLQGSGPVDVPPLHVLKRSSQNGPQGGVVPAGQTSSDPGWNSAPPVVRTGGDRLFRIPQGGMSMRAVARLTLSNEQRWKDIWELNPQLRPDEILPVGTDLRLPADARTP